ncbi:MAG TPA: cation:proton antiporter [Gemmatimonadaceae bacterium]|nr:cation:proton antiporter [Gemmatimonadaceae bacterium]
MSSLDGAVDGGTLGTRSVWRTALAYTLLVGLPCLAVAALLRLGSGLPVASGIVPPSRATGAGAGFDLALLAAQLVVVVTAARLCGALARRVGQPRVVGEMAAGLLLGPSVLGRLAPSVTDALFPAPSLAFVNALAQIGVLLFMFVVGLELDVAHLRRRGRTALLASHASIVAPFLLGTALALALYERYAPSGVGFVPFALFMGAAMSVTAFPVLARILTDRNLTGTPLGSLAIACAAVDDVTAWCILAAVVLVARAGDGGALVVTIAGTAVFATAMIMLGRPLLARLTARAARSADGGEGFLAVVLLVALGSAWVTERLGVHALFGAFLVGALLPKPSPVVEQLVARLRDLLVVLLLPLFFAFTGLRTAIALTADGATWMAYAAVLGVAIVGKLGGTSVAARVAGMSWRDALSLGALMNTRGLMELVILNVGLDIGVLSPPLFAMMVVMALVTTALTTPLLDRLQRPTAVAVPSGAGA